MNKRMKKKRALEKRVQDLESVCDFMLFFDDRVAKQLGKLQAIVSENAAATNNRFDAVESAVKALKKTQKKPWFNRN